MLKIGIIGFGRIGKVHARSIQTRVENACVLRICDPFMNPAMEAKHKSSAFSDGEPTPGN